MELITLDFESLDPDSLNGVTVRKHNDLIEARYKLPNLREQQVIFALLGKIRPEDEDFKGYQISVSDFAKFIGVNSKSIYEDMEQTLTNLAERTVKIKQGKSFLVASWLSSAKYVHGSGYVELRFDPNLKPYLLQLKDHYTQYKLEAVLHFKSVYSIRLYEMLKKEAFKAKIDPESKTKRFEVEYTYEEMREAFGINKKEYKLFAHFRTKTIEPAVTEIYDKTELNIYDVVYGKTGRAISRILFKVELRSKAEGDVRAVQIRLDEQPKESKKEEIKARLQELGYSPEYASRDVNKYGIQRIERSIAYTLAKQQAGEVKNFPAYLSKVIEGDLGGAWEQAVIDGNTKIEKQKQEEQEKAKKEEQETIEKEKKVNEIIDNFFLLDKEDRETLMREFLYSLIPQMRRFSENAIQEQGEEAIRNHKPTKSLFLAFMKG
jgi:plasmid replication initiation protein